MDGFPTEGGRTTPSALAKDRNSGMLSLACERACRSKGLPVSGGAVGKPTAFVSVEFLHTQHLKPD